MRTRRRARECSLAFIRGQACGGLLTPSGGLLELPVRIGRATLAGLAYLGGLARLGLRAAYYAFVAPFRGKPMRFQRAVHQSMAVGVEALPILSLISFFIGVILALQGAYELRKFGALNYVSSAVDISLSRELGQLHNAIDVTG